MSLKPPLSELEQAVMNVIWSHGSATATDVQTALLPQRAFRDSTVRTLLTRLEEKGYLEHALERRTFVYFSIEPPLSLAVQAVKQLIDRFCQGSVESLLAGMVDDEMVDSEELRRIAERLATQSSAKSHTNPKRKGHSK